MPETEVADPLLDQIQKVLDTRAAGQSVEEDPRAEIAAPAEEENTTDAPAETAESVVDSDDEATSDVTAAVEEKEEPPSEDESSHLDYERALTALRRAKVPKSVIDTMPKSEALRWGLETAERLAFSDSLIRENSELKKKTTEAKPVQSDSDDELPDEVQTLVAPIVEYAGKETADAVIGVARAIQAKATQREALLGGALDSILANNARRGLVERFPQLKDAERFKQVREKAKKLIATGDYQSDDMEEGYAQAMLDASKLLFSDEMEAAARTQQRNGRKSQAPTATSKVATPRVLTEDQKLTATIMDLSEGKLTPEQARAKYWP